MKLDRRNVLQYMRFIAHSFNTICCNEYGQVVNIDAGDKVFEDIFGVKNVCTRLYTSSYVQDSFDIVCEVGLESIIKLFDHVYSRNILEELISTRNRIDKLKKEAKKLYSKISKGKSSKKHKEQDLANYKVKNKELKYAQEVYNDAIKAMRKSLGIKNSKKKGYSKERYKYLKDFSKSFKEREKLNYPGEDDFDDFESAYDFAMDSGKSYLTKMSIPDDDFDEDEDESNFMKFMKAEAKKHKKKAYVPDDEDDDDNDEEEDDYSQFAKKMNKLYNVNNQDDEDDDDDEEDDDFDINPAVAAKFDDLENKFDMIRDMLSKIIPGGKEALKDMNVPDSHKNQIEPCDDQDDINKRIINAIAKLNEKIDTEVARLGKNTEILGNAVTTMYNAIMEDDEDEDQEDEDHGLDGNTHNQDLVINSSDDFEDDDDHTTVIGDGDSNSENTLKTDGSKTDDSNNSIKIPIMDSGNGPNSDETDWMKKQRLQREARDKQRDKNNNT